MKYRFFANIILEQRWLASFSLFQEYQATCYYGGQWVRSLTFPPLSPSCPQNSTSPLHLNEIESPALTPPTTPQRLCSLPSSLPFILYLSRLLVLTDPNAEWSPVFEDPTFRSYTVTSRHASQPIVALGNMTGMIAILHKGSANSWNNQFSSFYKSIFLLLFACVS